MVVGRYQIFVSFVLSVAEGAAATTDRTQLKKHRMRNLLNAKPPKVEAITEDEKVDVNAYEEDADEDEDDEEVEKEEEETFSDGEKRGPFSKNQNFKTQIVHQILVLLLFFL